MTHPDKNKLEAECAAPMPAHEAVELLRDALEHYNRLAPNTVTAREALRLTANVVAASPALDAEGLPPLPKKFGALYTGNYWTDKGTANSEALADVYTAEQVRQAQREAIAADRARQVFAWAAFADNGNVIIWSRRRDEVATVAAKYGKPVVPVIAHMDAWGGAGSGATSEAVSVMLWLYRRLPRTYGRPPHVETPIIALAKAAGVDMEDVTESFAERGAAPSPAPQGKEEA
jgi:hypothetical protein